MKVKARSCLELLMSLINTKVYGVRINVSPPSKSSYISDDQLTDGFAIFGPFENDIGIGELNF